MCRRGRKKGIKIGGEEEENGNRNKWNPEFVDMFW